MLLIDLFLLSNCLHGGILSAVVTYSTRGSYGLSHLNLKFVRSVRKFNIKNFILLVFIAVKSDGHTSILRWLFIHDILSCTLRSSLLSEIHTKI